MRNNRAIPRQLLALGALSAALHAAPPQKAMEIRRGVVQQYEDGPPLRKPDTVTAGETIHFSFFLDGFARRENQVGVSYTAQAFDLSGIPLATVLSGKSETTLSAEDKDWEPKLRGSMMLPELLFAGEYKIHIKAKDEISGASVELDIPFLVAGPPAPSAEVLRGDALQIENLNFYRDDEAEKPLDVAAYRSGEDVHARFVIAGFRRKSGEPLDVSYAIKLIDPTGKVLFENKEAARDNTAEFYPKPYIPAQLALSLKKGTPAGEFTLEVTARDAAGHHEASARRSFRLE